MIDPVLVISQSPPAPRKYFGRYGKVPFLKDDQEGRLAVLLVEHASHILWQVTENQEICFAYGSKHPISNNSGKKPRVSRAKGKPKAKPSAGPGQ